MNKLIVLLLTLPVLSFSQEPKVKTEAGTFSLGLRSAISAFNHNRSGNVGLGYGGQFRLQFSDRVNSEWYADFISADVSGLANRQDAHIGWHIMYYVMKPQPAQRLFEPYVLAGHCFDYTRLTDNSQVLDTKKRWSAAVQAGAGTHVNITSEFDISFVMQYMLHLGTHVDAHINDSHDHQSSEPHHPEGLTFKQGKGGPEGHLLFNISLNYKLSDLW